MARNRKPIRWSTRCAALTVALLELPHEIAKTKTEKEINAMVELDHFPIRHADGGPDTHWNLRPLFSQDHRLKTKADAKDMAKERKVRRAVDEHAQRMLLKREAGDAFVDAWAKRTRQRWPSRFKTWIDAEERESSLFKRWPSRPFPKRKKEQERRRR